MLVTRPPLPIWSLSRRYLIGLGMLALASGTCLAQVKPPSDQSIESQQRELFNNRELLSSFGRVMQKLQTGVNLPEPRTQGRLLSVLPKNTLFFAAIPNYGDAAQQALEVFRQE